MNLKWIFIFNIFLCSAYASYPNLEGLFRNSSNKDIEGKSVQLKFSVKTIREIKGTDINNEVELPVSIEEVKEYYRMYFDLTYAGRVDLISIKYLNANYNKNAVEDVLYIKDIYKRLDQEEDLDVLAFYSQIIFLALNDSYGFKKILKNFGTDFVNDSDKMDREKLSLYRSYKRYLEKVNSDDNTEVDLVSPMKPVEEASRYKVKEILQKNMYTKNEKVSLVREGRRFFWKADLGGVKAIFTNRYHRIKFLEIDSTIGKYTAAFDQFVLMNGMHELPKKVEVNSLDNEKLIIEFSDYSVREEKNFRRLYKYFKDEKRTSPALSNEVIPTKGFDFFYTL